MLTGQSVFQAGPYPHLPFLLLMEASPKDGGQVVPLFPALSLLEHYQPQVPPVLPLCLFSSFLSGISLKLNLEFLTV